jgi:hypothetical protein
MVRRDAVQPSANVSAASNESARNVGILQIMMGVLAQGIDQFWGDQSDCDNEGMTRGG